MPSPRCEVLKIPTEENFLAWEIPLTEEPGELHSLGLQTVRYNLVTKQQQEVT